SPAGTVAAAIGNEEIGSTRVTGVESQRVVALPPPDAQVASATKGSTAAGAPASRLITDDSLARGPPAADGSLTEASRQNLRSDSSSSEPSSDDASGAGLLSLSEHDLRDIARAAIEYWSSLDLDPVLLDRLHDISFVISDLDGQTLGQAEGLLIRIDPTAAGRGWFVDET